VACALGVHPVDIWHDWYELPIRPHLCVPNPHRARRVREAIAAGRPYEHLLELTG
jgi:hypothetical protein